MNHMTAPPLFITIAQGSETRTAIRLAPGSSGIYKTVGNSLQLQGKILSGGQVLPWKWSGLHEQDGWIYLIFPFDNRRSQDPLRPLEEIFSGSPEYALKVLKTFLLSLSDLKRRGEITPEAYQLKGCFFDDTLQFHILHPLVGEIMDREAEKDYLPSGTSGERELVYRLLRRLHSCFLSSSPGSHASPSYTEPPRPVHPHEQLPDLRNDIAGFLFSVVVEEKIPSFDIMVKNIVEWADCPLYEDRNPKEKSETLGKAQSLSARSRRRKYRAHLKKKYGTVFTATAAGLVVLGFLIAPVIRRSLEPDITEGLQPTEVIRLFYESQNSLDHQIMEECTLKNAGSSHLNQVTTLFVISRVRQGLEMKNFFLSAPEWIEQGKPGLEDGRFVFGNTDLTIQSLPEENGYRVDYTRWTTLPPEASDTLSEEQRSAIDSLQQVEAYRIREYLHMTETKKGWKIDELREIDRQSVNASRLHSEKTDPRNSMREVLINRPPANPVPRARLSLRS